MLEDRSKYPTLCVLKGEDGSCYHCVCTVDEWVFESNLKKARRITPEFLNWCVSSETLSTKFVGVLWSIRLCPSTPRFLLPQQIELADTVHASAAEFFMQCGERILANWFVHFAPHSITRETAFQHFLAQMDYFLGLISP